MEINLSIFGALKTIKDLKCVYQRDTTKVPKNLDPSIEKDFSVKQQSSRLKMFFHLTDTEKNIGINDMVIKSASKINHGRFTNQYRGSLYRGVSRNGKSW